MGDAVAVGDDEGRPRVRLGLAEGPEGLRVAAAHGDARHVDVAVGHRHQGQVLLGGRLAARRELRDGGAGGGLRHLAAGVRVHLGVEDQDVDVLARGQDVVEAAKPDVVRPAVAADDPHGSLDESVGDAPQLAGLRRDDPLQSLPELDDSLPLDLDAGIGGLVGFEQRGTDVAQAGAETAHQLARVARLPVERHPHAEPELGVVLEERVGPGGAASVPVHGPGSGGLVAPVDGRAAGRVGDDHAIVEELREELEVRRLPAPRAGPREFEEGQEQLDVLDLTGVERVPIRIRQREEEVPARRVGRVPRRPLHHVDGPVPRLALALRRTDLHTERAPGAITRRDLQGEPRLAELAPPGGSRLEGRRGPREAAGLVDLGADDRVRADEHALAALDAEGLVPDRDLGRDPTLLPARGPGRVGPVGGQSAHRQGIALPRDHPGRDPVHEVGRLGRHGSAQLGAARDRRRDRRLEQVRQRGIHGLPVPLDHRLAPPAVRLADRALDRGDRLVPRQHAADREEARLHDGVHAARHARRARHPVRVDHEHPHALVDDLTLGGPRQAVPDRLRTVRAVEEEHGAGLGVPEHVEALEERELMARDEGRAADEVRGVDGPGPEPEVRHRHRARLLGVVDEVALGVVIRLLADDLDRALVRADRPVGAEAVEDRAHVGRILRGEGGIPGQAGLRHVVVDADREVRARPRARHRVEDALHHARGEFLRAEAVAPSDHLRRSRESPTARGRRLGHRRHHVQIERLAHAARLLGAIQHRERAHRGRQGRQEGLGRERAVEPDLEDTDLLAVPREVLDRLLGGLPSRAHDDDHALGIGSPDVVEEVIGAADERGESIHRVLHQGRAGPVVRIGGLPRLEEDVGVLRGAADDRVVRRERPGAVGPDQIVTDHGPEVLGRERLDLGDLVRGAEPVEEVQERHPRLQGDRVGDRGQIHGLLDRAGGQHREAGGPGRHDVAVIAEDRQGLGREGPRGHVEDGGGQLPRDLVHVGDHQQQALRRGERGGERAGLERSVQRPRRPALALHLHHRGHRPPQVREALRGPLVGLLTHRRRRRDRVDRDHLAGLVGHAGRGLVAVDGDAPPPGRAGRRLREGRRRHHVLPTAGS